MCTFQIRFFFFNLQRILLHPNGKVRSAGRQRRSAKVRRHSCQQGQRNLQGAQFTLQPQQSHRGEFVLTNLNSY